MDALLGASHRFIARKRIHVVLSCHGRPVYMLTTQGSFIVPMPYLETKRLEDFAIMADSKAGFGTSDDKMAYL